MTSLTLFSRFSRCVMTLGVLADEIGPPAAPEHASAPAAAPATVVELASDDARATIERRVGTLSPSGIPLLETGVSAHVYDTTATTYEPVMSFGASSFSLKLEAK